MILTHGAYKCNFNEELPVSEGFLKWVLINLIIMGNVNGREDGSSSPSGVEEGESNNSVQEEGMGAPDGLMGQSPPHSPRTTHSPLLFTPQVTFLSSIFFSF